MITVDPGDAWSPVDTPQFSLSKKRPGILSSGLLNTFLDSRQTLFPHRVRLFLLCGFLGFPAWQSPGEPFKNTDCSCVTWAPCWIYVAQSGAQKSKSKKLSVDSDSARLVLGATRSSDPIGEWWGGLGHGACLCRPWNPSAAPASRLACRALSDLHFPSCGNFPSA